jgi:hypothetical protein
MVLKLAETGLNDFEVVANALLHKGREIARFPTPVCELARLGDQLFVVLHPFAPGDRAYSGTNLWSVNLRGDLLWKAPDANAKRPSGDPEFYRGVIIYNPVAPKLHVGMWDDRRITLLDAVTGAELQARDDYFETDIHDEIIVRSRLYLMALAMTPPERSHLVP